MIYQCHFKYQGLLTDGLLKLDDSGSELKVVWQWCFYLVPLTIPGNHKWRWHVLSHYLVNHILCSYDADYLLLLFSPNSHLTYPCLGEANGIRVSRGSVSSDAFKGRIVEGKQIRQLRTTKPLKTLPFNRECRRLKINGSLRQLSLAYSHKVKFETEVAEFLGTRKPTSNQTSRLCWYVFI